MFFCILLSSSLFASGKLEELRAAKNPSHSEGETLETGSQAAADAETTTIIIGRITIYGNEPYTFVGIVAENGTEYAVYSPSHEAELRTLQGHIIEFTVVLLDEPQGYGSLFLKGGTVSPLAWEILE